MFIVFAPPFSTKTHSPSLLQLARVNSSTNHENKNNPEKQERVKRGALLVRVEDRLEEEGVESEEGRPEGDVAGCDDADVFYGVSAADVPGGAAELRGLGWGGGLGVKVRGDFIRNAQHAIKITSPLLKTQQYPTLRPSRISPAWSGAGSSSQR